MSPGHNDCRSTAMSLAIGFASSTAAAPGFTRASRRRVDEAVGDGLGIAARREQVRDVVGLDDVLARERRAARRLRPASPESRRSRTCGRPPRSGPPRSRCRSGTPAASRASPSVVALCFHLEPLEDFRDLLRRHLDAEHGAQPLAPQGHGRPLGRSARALDVRDRAGVARRRSSSSSSRRALDGADLARRDRRRARSAARRPCAGRAGARRPTIAAGAKNALSRNTESVVALDGRRLAAHDAGQPDRPARVRDHEHVGRRARRRGRRAA